MISFERTKTNHDKLPHENNTESNNNTSNYIPNFQAVFFENNSREFGTLNAVCEETRRLTNVKTALF